MSAASTRSTLREVQAATNDSLIPADAIPEGIRQEQGVRLIPREVYNEIHSTIQGSSLGGRTVDKLQGLQSTVLLGTNPSWLQVQVAANAFITTAKTRGNVASFIRAPEFFRKLDPETRQAIDDLFGTGPAEAHGHRVHLGAAANNRIVDGYRAMREALSFKYQAAKNSVPVLRNVPLNPIHLMFAADNAQNRYFKRVALYDEMRKQAFRDMARAGDNAFHLQGPLSEMLSLDPKGRIEAMLRDPEQVLKHAQAVDEVLGNYVRYTAKERRFLKRYVLFYGFMRYSLRMLFYTMPVKHPITMGVVAKLAQLHNQEVADLLGGDETPWAFSKLFTDHGRKSIDLARLNPVSNPLVSLATENRPAAVLGFLSPAFTIALDQAYSQDSFTGQPFKVGGSTQEARNLPLFSGARGRIVLNEALSLAFPYRAASQALNPEKQTSDTLLWDPMPVRYKDPKLKAEQAKKAKQKGDVGSILFQQALPFLPRPDFSKQTAEAVRELQHKKKPKKKGGNLFAPAGGAKSGSF
jgi:hypothetical protein